MKKTTRWLLAFSITSLIVMCVAAAIVIVVDPFFQYHKPLAGFPYIVDNQVNMNPGLARNMDYDSVILGSSMTVNFNTDWFRDELGLQTMKLSYNGAYPKDQANIMDIIFEAKGDSVKQVFLGIDEMNYSAGVEETKFPITNYLYDKNKLNDIQYLLNKDVILDYCIKPLFDRSDATQWNMIYPFWWQEEHYMKALVLMYYEPAEVVEKGPDVHDFDAAITANMEQNIIPYIEAHPDTQFNIFFPPYSILYWNDAVNMKELDAVMQKYRVIANSLFKYDNVKMYFFTNEEEIICDLNNYADYTHYKGDVCYYMVECFKDGTHMLTEDNLEEELKKLYDLASTYDYPAIWDDWYN